MLFRSGIFLLKDAFKEKINGREVFKFQLETIPYEKQDIYKPNENIDLEHTRFIPSKIKKEVWVRDNGKCVICGSRENLHFDHIIPYSKGGSSLVSENIQLLCAKHNLQKRASIE